MSVSFVSSAGYSRLLTSLAATTDSQASIISPLVEVEECFRLREAKSCSFFKPWLTEIKARELLKALSPGSWLIISADCSNIYKIPVRVAGTLWWYEITTEDPNPFSSLQRSMGIELVPRESSSRLFSYTLLSSYLDGEETVVNRPIYFPCEASFFEYLFSTEIEDEGYVRSFGPCLELPVISLALTGQGYWHPFSRTEAESYLKDHYSFPSKNGSACLFRPLNEASLEGILTFRMGKVAHAEFEYLADTGVYSYTQGGVCVEKRSFKEFVEDLCRKFNRSAVKSFLDVDLNRLTEFSASYYMQELQYLFQKGYFFSVGRECVDFSAPVGPAYYFFLEPTDYKMLEAICSVCSIPNRCFFKWESLAGIDLLRMKVLFQSPTSCPEMCVKIVDALIDHHVPCHPSFLKKPEFQIYWQSQQEGKGDWNLSIKEDEVGLNCHRHILESQSPYFRDVFNGSLPNRILESQERAKLLVSAFYNKEKITMDNVIDYLELAVSYKFSNLKDRVIAFLQQNKIENNLVWRALNREARIAFLCRLVGSLAKMSIPCIRV